MSRSQEKLPLTKSVLPLAVFFIFIVLFNSATAEVYRADIIVRHKIRNQLEFYTTPDDINLLIADIDGFLKPIRNISSGHYIVDGVGTIEPGVHMSFFFFTDKETQSLDAVFSFKIDDNFEDYKPFLLPTSGNLLDVTDSLTLGVAGALDTHKVGFAIADFQIEPKGEIWVTFSSGFGVDSDTLVSAVYSDNDPANDGDQPIITSIDVDAQTVKFKLDEGTPAALGSRIDVDFSEVRNDTVAGSYYVVIMTVDSLGNLVNGPTSSELFTLSASDLDHIIVTPENDLIVPSDSIVIFNATGQDQYGNDITGLTYDWNITVDSCGSIDEGAFQAIKLGSCYITATSGGIMDSSGMVTVIPGIFGRFDLSGYPLSRTAGAFFPAPVLVIIYDVNDNIKYDYGDSVYFFSSDASAQLPEPYQFQPASDSGQYSFPGTDFRLRIAGYQTINITDDHDTTTSDIINVIPAPISAFTFLDVVSQTAGLPFDLYVTNAVDSINNPSSGNVVISCSFGGGSSPDGVPPVYNDVVVNNGNGSASQTLTNAVPTVLRGIVGGAEVFTDTFDVIPGVLGNLGLTGYPDTVTAGETFPSPLNDPTVTVYDLYGNLKYNFTGTVTFSSTDINAVLPAPYNFVPTSDSGQHSFDGSEFSFQTAGLQKLIITSDSAADTSSNIRVFAALINSFTLNAPAIVTAGGAFLLDVTGALDQFSNPASGIVVISDSTGGDNAPDGTPPVYNNIHVEDGTGDAEQILVRTGIAVLKGTAESIISVTDSITVNPGSLGDLDVVVDTPIVSGNPMPDGSSITAEDIFGNVKTDFDASADTVVISASTGGPIENNVLNQVSDFASGVADLALLNVTYNGPGGPVMFSVTSQSGIIGQSNVVDVVSLSADDLTLDIHQVARLDTVTGTVSLTNLSGVPVVITDIELFDEDGYNQFNPDFTPALPDTVSGGMDTTFAFSFVVPDNIPMGQHPLSMKITGMYSGMLTYDSLEVFTDTLVVLSASQLVYLDSTISPIEVSTGLDYSFSVVVRNDGDASISLDDTSYIYFSDGTREYNANLYQSIIIEPGVQGNIVFDQLQVSSSFTGGIYPVWIYIYGTELNGSVVDSILLSDSVVVQTAVDITFESGSSMPDTVLTGSEVSFTVRVNNSGQATLFLDHDLTRISFSDGVNLYNALIDTSSGVRIDEIQTGDTSLTFFSSVVPSGFAPGTYQPVVHIAGIQNQHPFSVDLNIDSVTVITPGQIRLDSLYTVSFNAPRVNTSQQFIIHGYTSNLGIEPVDSIYLSLISDGGSSFAETLYVGTIDGLSGATFDYNITANSVSDPSEIFQCSIIYAINRISGQDAQIASPLDNSAIAVIEEPVVFWIDTLYVLDDSLSTGQLFTVFGQVSHSGSDSYSGSDQLVIDFAGDAEFVVADSLTRDFIPGQIVSWDVTAPSSVRASAPIEVAFNGAFIDLNDSTTALGLDSTVTIIIVITNRASISHRAYITSPSGATDSIMSTSQFFVVTDSLFPSGNISSSFARLVLPSGFGCIDPVVQELTGQVITWQVSAPSDVAVDSLRIDCWSFDSNTGDSVYGAIIWIPVEVVEKATLTLGVDITQPPSALDRVIEPGGYFVLEALVENIGQAGTGNGELTILFENDDFSTDEPIARIFIPGIPVQWTVSAPDTQILSGTEVAVIMSSIPVDLNSGESAFALNDSAGFDIILKNELPRLVLRNPAPIKGAAVSGQPVDVYRFSLENSTEIGQNQVALTSLVYRVLYNNDVVSPGQIFSTSVLFIDNTPYNGEFNDSTVNFIFDPGVLIEPDMSVELVLNVTPVQNPVVDVFRITIDSDDIYARAVIEGVYEQYIQVVLPDGDDFIIETGNLAMLGDDFTSSVRVNNNPYLASDGELEIGYNLSDEAIIDFIIYSINGEKVWEYRATPTTDEGTAGGHYGENAVKWNGLNSSAVKVLSGVYYIIVNNNSTGETTKLKVAVIW